MVICLLKVEVIFPDSVFVVLFLRQDEVIFPKSVKFISLAQVVPGLVWPAVSAESWPKTPFLSFPKVGLVVICMLKVDVIFPEQGL